MEKGYFITFEGIDGCGKTTQQNKVSEFLTAKNIENIKTREPGGAEFGKKLREILLHYDGDVSSNCETFLFLADRSQHIDTLIKPAIEQGKIVLCDRHTDSTIAYQSYGRGLDINRIKMLNDIAVNGVKPDLTLIFDIDLETSFSRLQGEKDRMESAGIEFYKRVKEGYLEIAKQEPTRVKIINANNSIEKVFDDTIQTIKETLGLE